MIATAGRSLRFRLLLAALAWICGATILAGLFISGLFVAHLNRTVREDLTHHLSELIALTRLDEQRRPYVVRPLSDPRFQQPGSGMVWQIERSDGPSIVSPSLLRGPSLFPRLPSSLPGRSVELAADQVVAGTPLRFRIREDAQLLDREISAHRTDLAKSLAALAALLIVGVVLQLWFGLRPLKQLGDAVDELRNGARRRLPGDVPAEFSRLVTRLNELLDSQATLVERGRLEAGNLAHALRTPLALVASELDALRSTGQAETADFLQDQCDAMRRQIDYHMNRAAAAGTHGGENATELRPVVSAIIAALDKLHRHRRIQVRSEIADDLMVRSDPGDLFEILSNLLDNAYKWASCTVRIAARRTATEMEIEISDDGPGIDPDRREDVLAAGVQLDTLRPGVGLGLSITNELVAMCGGRISLGGQLGDGLVVTLAFPHQAASAGICT